MKKQSVLSMRLKQILVISLIVIMSFTMVACTTDNGGGGEDEVISTADSNIEQKTEGGPNANADGSVNLNTVAHFDPDFDYTSSGEPFKVKYFVVSSGPLYEDFDKAFAHWAPLIKMQYDGIASANGDSDLYMNMLQEAIDQGYDGLILDPDNNTFPRVISLLNQYPDVQWMSGMSPVRDLNADVDIDAGENYPLLHPSVGFDYYQNGVMSTEKLVEYKEANWPDAAWEDIGFISLDFSLSPPIHVRSVGAEAKWEEITGSRDNIFYLDTSSGQLDMNTAQELVQTTLATNDYKYWLVSALIDDFAQGAAVALDTLGLTDTSCVVCIGGSALQKQLDAGQEDAWRYAFFTAQNIFAEPIIGALYAFMAGYANYENIWPEWVNENDRGVGEHRYASLLLPSVWIDKDNYKNYLEWTDIYAEANAYDYPQTGITRDTYSPYETVPASYQKQ